MNLKRLKISPIAILLLAVALAACARTTTTAKKVSQRVTTAQEVQIGEQNYLAARQSQGGDYALDADLSAYVRAVGLKLAKLSNRPELPYDFVVVNNSAPNAWALPGGKIAVSRGLLLELNNEAELAAVLGHEIVHAAARHGANALERGTVSTPGVATAGTVLGDKDGAALLVGVGASGAQLIGKQYARDAELEADRISMEYLTDAGYDPRAAVTLQETFVRLLNAEKTIGLAGMLASHPPSPERVEANKTTAATLDAQGSLGVEAYQAKISGLKKNRSAYAKLDEGSKALAGTNLEQALSAAAAAIKIEPREAKFFGLRAYARLKQKRLPEALADLNQAIAKNQDFFQFYLQRGLLKQKLSDTSARTDLEKSIALLPTATAYHALGEEALKRDDKEYAKQLFAMAAQSESEIGKRALLRLTRFDIAEFPEKYVVVDASRDAHGYVVVNLQNRSPVKVHNIKAAIAWFDTRGNIVAQDSLTLADVLNPRQSVTESTRIGPLPSDQELSLIRVKVFSMDLGE